VTGKKIEYPSPTCSHYSRHQNSESATQNQDFSFGVSDDKNIYIFFEDKQIGMKWTRFVES